MKNNNYKYLYKFIENNYQYSIIDVLKEDKSLNERHLSVKHDELSINYICSSIYLDSNRIFQPAYLEPQRIINYIVDNFCIKSILVLGCAGCTIPRFINKKDSKIKVVGIEKSKIMVDVAKEFFFVDEYSPNFELLNCNAYEFVKSTKNKFDIIYVDIFNGYNLDVFVFNHEFIENIYKICKKNSMVIFNLLNIYTKDYLDKIAINNNFDNYFVIYKENHYYLICVNGKLNEPNSIIENIKGNARLVFEMISETKKENTDNVRNS